MAVPPGDRGRPMTTPVASGNARPVAGGILLQGERLNKRFGGVQAVRDVSLNIPHGSTFAIIGPNGAGKSTLLNLLTRLYPPDAGTIRLDRVGLVRPPAHPPAAA